MTWQSGKLQRADSASAPLARPRPLAGPTDDPEKSFEKLARTRGGLENPVRLHIRLVTGRST